MRKYPEKGETEEEYTKNRAKRIDVGHDCYQLRGVDGELYIHPGGLQGQDVIWSQVEISRIHSQVWAKIAHS